MQTTTLSDYLGSLCESTRHLLRPIRFAKSDRLSLLLDGEHFIVDAYSLSSDGIKGFASTNASYHWFARIPERKQMVHGEGSRWRLAATDFTVVVINSLWSKDQIVFKSRETRITYEHLLLRFIKQVHGIRDRALDIAEEEENGQLKLDLSPWIDCKELPLARYQRQGLSACIQEEGFALFMEQGTGKTPIVIARVCNEAAIRVDKSRPYTCLVVCPKNVRMNWKTEFIRFATRRGKLATLRGSKFDRIKSMVDAFNTDESHEWVTVVVSYEGLMRTWEQLKLVSWDLGVLDESHFIKSPITKRYKRAMELRPICRSRMCLTGTPVTNTPFDLFAQLEFLGQGFSGFATWKAFRNYYGIFARRGQFTTVVDFQNLPLLQERVARCSYSVKKVDALPELPPKTRAIIEVSMTNEQAEIYRQVATQLAIEIKEEKKELLINNVLTKLLRLAQITSGFVSWDPVIDEQGEVIKERQLDRFDPNPKLEALVELLKTSLDKGDKFIVWAYFVQDIKTLAARLCEEGYSIVTYYGATKEVDREIAIQRFNGDPTCLGFVGHPAAGGTGINLRGYDEHTDTNVRQVVYYSQNWSMVYRAQSEDRSHRRGTRANVHYTDLCVPSSIDEQIRERVTDKRVRALAIQDVREIISRVLAAMPQQNGD